MQFSVHELYGTVQFMLNLGSLAVEKKCKLFQLPNVLCFKMVDNSGCNYFQIRKEHFSMSRIVFEILAQFDSSLIYKFLVIN